MKRSRIPLITTLFVLLFFYLPIAVLVINSFNAAKYGTAWHGFTVRWYSELWQHQAIRKALGNTLVVGIVSMLCSTVLGTLGALALHRYKPSRLQKIHGALVWCPLMLPEILMGVGLLIFLGSLGFAFGRVTMIIAHTTFCVSYVVMVVLARLQDFDEAILEAALDLGATWWQTAWRILLPIMLPGIAAGALLAFTLSIDDFVISFFVQGKGMTTLPIQVYGMLKRSPMGIINALSTLMLVATFTLLLFSQILARDTLTPSGNKTK